MVYRTTYQFTSAKGRPYVYDDSSGMIFPWTAAREAALGSYLAGYLDRDQLSLERRFGVEEAAAASLFIRHWGEGYGAFRRADTGDLTDAESSGHLQLYIRQSCRQLILNITEGCNLRCRYCTFSDAYPNTRSHSARRMTPAMATRAIDWFAKFVRPHLLAVGKRGYFGLSFFGGEPLSNLATLKAALEYSRREYTGVFSPVLTTNGTLLTPEASELLVEHGVGLSISIDGPESEHDRLRVFQSGRGTFAIVMQNLLRLAKEYPDYCRQHVNGICVYDWGTNVERVMEFFQEYKGLFPLGLRVSSVTTTFDSHYYDRFTEAEKESHRTSIARFWEEYVQKIIEGDDVDPFSDALFGAWLVIVLGRPRIGDGRPVAMPYTGSCLPGTKVAIQVDGTMTACERVNGSFPLGHLDGGGFDWDRAYEMLQKYKRSLPQCAGCHISRLCQICFAHLEGRGEFHNARPVCAAAASTSEEVLRRYVSILEENSRPQIRGWQMSNLDKLSDECTPERKAASTTVETRHRNDGCEGSSVTAQ